MKKCFLRTLLGLGVALGGCTVAQPLVRIHGDFEVAASDDQLLFAAISPGYSGLYTLRTTNPAVVSAVLVRRNSGIFSSPCYLARHHRLVYLYHQRGGSTIESCTLAGDSVQTLFATSFPLTSLAVAPTEDRLYFVAARNVGHSSPVAPVSARDVRLYTLALGDSTARPASHLQAYQSRGKPQFDASGQHLLLNLFSPEEVGLSGPFALNLSHDDLRYLMPISLLRHKTRLREPLTGTTARFNWLFQDFVRPVPAYLDSGYYLIDYHQVIKVSAGAAPPQMLYRNWLTGSKSADTAEAYSIAGPRHCTIQIACWCTKKASKPCASYYLGLTDTGGNCLCRCPCPGQRISFVFVRRMRKSATASRRSRQRAGVNPAPLCLAAASCVSRAHRSGCHDWLSARKNNVKGRCQRGRPGQQSAGWRG